MHKDVTGTTLRLHRGELYTFVLCYTKQTISLGEGKRRWLLFPSAAHHIAMSSHIDARGISVDRLHGQHRGTTVKVSSLELASWGKNMHSCGTRGGGGPRSSVCRLYCVCVLIGFNNLLPFLRNRRRGISVFITFSSVLWAAYNIFLICLSGIPVQYYGGGTWLLNVICIIMSTRFA